MRQLPDEFKVNGHQVSPDPDSLQPHALLLLQFIAVFVTVTGTFSFVNGPFFRNFQTLKADSLVQAQFSSIVFAVIIRCYFLIPGFFR